MKKLIKSICLVGVLLLIVTSCIARTLNNQMNTGDRSRHLIQKYQTNKLSCNAFYSFLTVCQNSVYGNMTFPSPYTNDCDTLIIDMHMNLSDITDTYYFHHYRGSIITKCGTNDISNYTIIGHVYFGDGHFNGTASMCNDDCDDLYFDGQYQLQAGNDTCHDILAAGVLC